jgi:hypothetical protein
MTQEERWLLRYNEVKTFIEANKRRPSKYSMTECNAWNWLRHTQKLYNGGELKEERVEKFEEILVLCEKYHHVNQYT